MEGKRSKDDRLLWKSGELSVEFEVSRVVVNCKVSTKVFPDLRVSKKQWQKHLSDARERYRYNFLSNRTFFEMKKTWYKFLTTIVSLKFQLNIIQSNTLYLYKF